MFMFQVLEDNKMQWMAMFKTSPSMAAIMECLTDFKQDEVLNIRDLKELMDKLTVDVHGRQFTITKVPTRDSYTGKLEPPLTFRNTGSLGGNHDMPSALDREG